MGATSRERYAVVSCHVERPLDDAVWARFSALQASRPGGFAVAALMRPPDPAFGEDESTWVARAREAVARGPLGHHTHWTAPDHARPTGARDGRARPRGGSEAARSSGSRRRSSVVAAGTRTSRSPRHARSSATSTARHAHRARPTSTAASSWASLSEPATVELPSDRTLRAIPTTHSLGRSRALAHVSRASYARPRLLPRHRPARPDADACCSGSCCGSSHAARGQPTWTRWPRKCPPTRPVSRGTTWPGSKLPRHVRQARPAGRDVAGRHRSRPPRIATSEPLASTCSRAGRSSPP